MEDDDDDFYGGSANTQGDHDQEMTGQDPAIKSQAMELGDEEEEDSDDDVQFTMEKPEVAKAEAAPATRASSKAVKVEPSTSSQSKTTRQQSTSATKPSTSETPVTKSELLHNGKEGKDFPEYRTSTVDVEEEAVWPANGKKITELDIDAELAEHSKPWRLPGTDVTDFFNYGFDEYTWTQYCAKQNTMSQNISELKDQDTMMKSVLNMGGGGDGMPDMNQMMQMMMGGMGGPGGGDPSQMDFSKMMAMGMPGGMPGMPPAGGPQPNSGFPGQQGNGSPMPQAGQGFQAPLGPSGMNMDGFSPQQMAIMQQEQQQGHQQGGGRGRGRRGRGYY